MIKPLRTDIKIVELRILCYLVGDFGVLFWWNNFFDVIGVLGVNWRITMVWGGEWGLMNCNCNICHLILVF